MKPFIPETSPSKLYAYIALGLGVLIVGFSAIFIRWADAPGTVTAFYRMGIATVIMTGPFLYALRTQRPSLPKRGIFLAFLGGACFGADLALWSTGVTMSGASNPTLLANTAPLWVGLGALIIFHERQNFRFWSGLILALGGAMIVLGNDLSRATELGLGTFFGLLAGLFYGASILIAQRGRSLLNTLSYFYISTGSSALFLLLVNLLLGHSFTGYSRMTYLVFLGIGAGIQVVGWLAVNYAQGYLPASVVSPTLLAQPVITALLAAILLGEIFTMWQIVGGVIVLLGIYIVHRSRHASIRKPS